jgi:hypothetical protein
LGKQRNSVWSSIREQHREGSKGSIAGRIQGSGDSIAGSTGTASRGNRGRAPMAASGCSFAGTTKENSTYRSACCRGAASLDNTKGTGVGRMGNSIAGNNPGASRASGYSTGRGQLQGAARGDVWGVIGGEHRDRVGDSIRGSMAQQGIEPVAASSSIIEGYREIQSGAAAGGGGAFEASSWGNTVAHANAAGEQHLGTGCGRGIGGEQASSKGDSRGPPLGAAAQVASGDSIRGQQEESMSDSIGANAGGSRETV